MYKFKHNDVVYCQAISINPQTLYTKENSSGVFLKHGGKEFWFSECGLYGGDELEIIGSALCSQLKLVFSGDNQ